jgi:hypothetical protein
MFIVDSCSFKNVFFIFRDNGDEVECKITKKHAVYPEKYKLTDEEIKAIKKRYKTKQINKNIKLL